MKYFFYFLLILGLFAINLGVFKNLPLGGQIPNLLLLLTICSALEKNNYDFFFFAFVSGVFLDSFSGGLFGAYSLALLVVAFSLNSLINNFVVMEFSKKTSVLLLAMSQILFNMLVWLYGLLSLRFGFVVGTVAFFESLRTWPSAFIYNLLLFFPVFWLFDKINTWIDIWVVRKRGLVR